MTDQTHSGFSTHLSESRLFPPPAEFQRDAGWNTRADYEQEWQRAIDDPENYWRHQAQQRLLWDKPFETVLGGAHPYYTWFEDGKLNASINCLDRHLESAGDRKAITWEGEPGDIRQITYRQLHSDVCKFANALKRQGLRCGDRVTIYMPLVPEAVVAMLACARLGLPHSVVFAGFSSEALAERNNDAAARLVITADGSWRRGELVPLKANVDQALLTSKTIEKVIVLKRTGHSVAMQSKRDFWWHDLVEEEESYCEAVSLSAEHPLFILYTSGSTGKPKGILHTTAGYLLGTNLTFAAVFDWRKTDLFWCTADVGWITGHSYVVYGPLSQGASIFMFEGAPTFPNPDRFWKMIAQHKITTLYTAPTAIRALMMCGDQWPESHDLSSLRLLGTVGEPINPKAWVWYREKIGGSRCPIVDTWWQTETGSIMMTPLPGVHDGAPGSVSAPFFGIVPALKDDTGEVVKGSSQGGYLCITSPWPSMLRGIYGDDERYRSTYWSRFPGSYFTGDGARQDELGQYWILGRVDDVLNVSGHRLSSMEIESALVAHRAVAEAAVVAKDHDVKGSCVSAFVTLKQGYQPSADLIRELSAEVVTHIGAIARPEEIRFAAALPKTRSGKIMRRLLKQVANCQPITGDVTTVEDLGSLVKLREKDSNLGG